MGFIFSHLIHAVLIFSAAVLPVLCFGITASFSQHSSARPADVQSVVTAADEAYSQGRFQDAVRLYSDAAKVLPGESTVFLGRGMTYEMLRDTHRAVEDLKKAIQCDPGNYRAMEQLASLYERMGNKDAEAAAFYQRALSLDPRPEWRESLSVSIGMLRTRLNKEGLSAVALWNLGNEAAQKGDLARAESLYSRAIGLDPLLYQAYFSRGLIGMKKQDFSSALADFDAGLAIDPRYPGGFVQRGLAAEGLGRFEQALDNFQQAARSDTWDPQAFYHLGRMLEKTGDYVHALQAYEKALTLHPKHDLPRLLNERISALRPRAAEAARAAGAKRSPPQRTLW
ncbi:MAG: tetratricopeptide repeat protein [Desulfomonile sp.]|nr:tetratricopeptide repeat protein [Desulfomonile sp.]